MNSTNDGDRLLTSPPMYTMALQGVSSSPSTTKGVSEEVRTPDMVTLSLSFTLCCSFSLCYSFSLSLSRITVEMSGISTIEESEVVVERREDVSQTTSIEDRGGD